MIARMSRRVSSGWAEADGFSGVMESTLKSKVRPVNACQGAIIFYGQKFFGTQSPRRPLRQGLFSSPCLTFQAETFQTFHRSDTSMNYREIVAVTGLPGLYQLLANKGDGAIVRELSGGASKFLPARLHRVTPLETIEVYTTGSNVRLQKVFEAMQASEGKETMPDAKADSATLRNYFDTVFPDYDGSRVYDSDLKKMVRWYGILKGADLLKFEEEEEETTLEDSAGDEQESAPAKKSSAKPKDKAATSNTGDGLASTADMPAEGEAQLAEEAKGNDVTGEGLVEDATAGKKPRAKKAAAKSEAASADAGNGGEAPAKKSRSKKAAEPAGGGDEAAPKKVARKKKETGEGDAA